MATPLVIPASAPADEELAARIKKLATYVARNGIEFERKIREKEGNNPQFQFLFDSSGDGYLYYRWVLFCTENQYTDAQVKCMEDNHSHRIEWRAPSGVLQLTQSDELDLQTLLENNIGTKDSIKALRKWTLDRSHSVVHIGLKFSQFADRLAQENGSAAHTRLLHTAYVLNDILYNAKSARPAGPYTRIAQTDSPMDLVTLLKPYLAPILRRCYQTADEEGQREKVLRLVELWTGKGFLTTEEAASLRASVTGDGELPVSIPALVSPHLENPLPSNNPQTATAGQQPSETAPAQGLVAMSALATAGLTEAQLAQLQLIQQRIQSQLFPSKPQGDPHPHQTPHSLPPAGLAQQPQLTLQLYQQHPGQHLPSPLPPASYPGAQPSHIPGFPPPHLPHHQTGMPPPQGYGAPPSYGGLPPPYLQGMYPPPPGPGAYPPHLLPPSHPPQSYAAYSPVPQHPVAVPVAPAPAPVVDLARIPVGNMTNIVKAAKRAAHPPHTTMDIMLYASHATPHVEPGRVEARVAEFYRCVDALLNPAPADPEGGNKPERRRDDSRERRHPISNGRREGDGRREGEEGWERYVPGYEDDRERAYEPDWERARSRKAARYTAPSAAASAAQEAQIAEDNMGHKLLRGLGWQEGSGLGAEGAGIVEPIRAKTSENRAGLGTGQNEVPTLQDGSIDYSSYRKQLSSQYHSRIVER